MVSADSLEVRMRRNAVGEKHHTAACNYKCVRYSLVIDKIRYIVSDSFHFIFSSRHLFILSRPFLMFCSLVA